VSSRRDQVNSSLRDRTRNLQSVIRRSDELSELSARFQLLEAQYVSDLERLDMIEEASWVLSQEATQFCPMCGTTLSAQSGGTHREAEASLLFESVRTERDRITGLLAGLRRTLTDIGKDVERLVEVRSSAESRVAQLRNTLREVDAESSIKLRDLEELQQKKAEVRRRLDVLNQIAALDRIRDEVVSDGQETAFEIPKVPTAELRHFESEIRSILEEWNVDGASQTYLDPKTLELSVGGKVAPGQR